jgi:Swiss Army Knife RNA repair-like protein
MSRFDRHVFPLSPLQKPVLLVDVDGVISLYGFAPDARPPGEFVLVDGIGHFLSAAAGPHLLDLARAYDLVWCTGWEERANEYLPAALGLPGPLPFLSFDPKPTGGRTHWKLPAVDAYVGARRPLAWIDDAHDAESRAWAARRTGPTLLVDTDPAVGITGTHVDRLNEWGHRLHAG